jgi:hypothetical protein
MLRTVNPSITAASKAGSMVEGNTEEGNTEEGNMVEGNTAGANTAGANTAGDNSVACMAAPNTVVEDNIEVANTVVVSMAMDNMEAGKLGATMLVANTGVDTTVGSIVLARPGANMVDVTVVITTADSANTMIPREIGVMEAVLLVAVVVELIAVAAVDEEDSMAKFARRFIIT